MKRKTVSPMSPRSRPVDLPVGFGQGDDHVQGPQDRLAFRMHVAVPGGASRVRCRWGDDAQHAVALGAT
jgi:hypothetical protein